MGSDFDAHRTPLQSEHVNCSGALRPPIGGDATLIERRYKANLSTVAAVCDRRWAAISTLIERRYKVKVPRQTIVIAFFCQFQLAGIIRANLKSVVSVPSSRPSILKNPVFFVIPIQKVCFRVDSCNPVASHEIPKETISISVRSSIAERSSGPARCPSS